MRIIYDATPAETTPGFLHGLWAAISRQFSLPAWVGYGLWLLLMIAMPHVLRLGGAQSLTLVLNGAVFLQASTVFLILWKHNGLGNTLRTAALIAVLAWAVEFLGSSTGVPFGSYGYSERLQPQILDVPLLIPLAWLMMLVPSWAVASFFLSPQRRLPFALFSGAAFTAWDLFLDPQMVAWDLWIWAQPGGYFGIPWVNYGGWLLAGTLITLAVRPHHLPTAALFLVYATTWLLESVGLTFYFQLPGPALVGFLLMGGVVSVALYKLAQESVR